MKQRILFFLIPATLLLAFQSCRTGKAYERPVLDLPAQFRDQAPTDSSIAAVGWKKLFYDSTLQQLIDTALIFNFDMQLATKRIAEAAAYVKQARAGYAPSVVTQLSANTSLPSENSLNGISLKNFIGTNHVEDYLLNVGVSWEIDIWGRIRSQKEAALANYLSSGEAARAIQTKLVSDIVQSYYNLLMLDKQVDITRRNLALSDTVVQMMRIQKQAGLVTELAVQQAEVQRQTASLLLPQLEEQIEIAGNTIRILSGKLPDKVIRRQELSEVTLPEGLAVGIPAAMISRRPDVRTSELALQAANAEANVAAAEMYPSLVISAAGGLNAFKASKWFMMPASLFATAAGTVAQPIVQRRRLRTQLEVARIRREEAVIYFRQAALNAVSEVVNALVTLEKGRVRKKIAAEQVDTLKLAVRNARLLFRSGLADYLEVITAQANLLTAELNLADLQRQQLNAMVELYRALGGGVQ